MSKPKWYIVSYDISDPKRWRQVFKAMKGYGDHLQYSVFLCHLTGKQRVLLEEKIRVAIHQQEDQVMFIHLGEMSQEKLNERLTTIGRSYIPKDWRTIIY